MPAALSAPALKYLFNTVTASATDENLPSCTITTINSDREGDRVIPEGGDFTDFMKSPVLMWAHGGKDGYSSIPIGTVTSLNVQPGQGVQAAWKWLEGDPFAERIKNAWEQGVVRASSIGFKPVQATPNGQGLDHEKWQLLELSLCAIPMNPEAVRTFKSLDLPILEAEQKGMTPANVSTELAPEGDSWSALTLKDFTDQQWSALSDAERRKITGHFAWAAEMPPMTFGDLKLGHHRASDGKVVFAGVVAAAGRLDQSNIPAADIPKIKAHLRAHYDAFGKPVPASLKSEESDVDTVSLKAELDALKAEFASVQKRGRVLSAVNESRLRAAMDALANAGVVLNEVLLQLMPMAEEPMDPEEPMPPMDHPEDAPKPSPMPMMALDAAETYSLNLAEDALGAGDLRLVLADEPGDGQTFTLVDGAGHEPVFTIDPDLMRATVSEAVKTQLQAALVEPISALIQRELNRARGRVE